MKILVIGAGRVGTSVAENLVGEDNEITVVDSDSQKISALEGRFDLKGIVGDASCPSVLASAGAADSDILIAVTSSDSVNLLTTTLSAELFNIPTRIVRVRNSELREYPDILGSKGFKATSLIWPEQAVADAIVRLVELPEALQVIEFANGRAALVTVQASAGGPLVGRPLRDLHVHLPNVQARIVSIFRQNRSIPVNGNSIIEADDEVLVLSSDQDKKVVVDELRRQMQPVHRIMIGGGASTGLTLARALDESRAFSAGSYNIKMVVENKEIVQKFSSKVSDRILLVAGSITDEVLLTKEGVAQTDLFIAMSGNDESNIMSALLAKRLGARRVIALINRQIYSDLVAGTPIDIAVSPVQATLSEILRHVRHGDVIAAHSIRRGASEALEVAVHGDESNSRVIGRKIGEIHMPDGCQIAAVVRISETSTSVMMSHRDLEILANDRLIVFVANKRLIPKVEKLFSVNAGFF